MKSRYFIRFSYKGTRYHGWQIQPNALTVQQIMNESLRTVIRDEIETTGAGRTDTGVHARTFTAHFDSSYNDLAIRKKLIIKNLNGILPVDIAVSDLCKVLPDAHARYSAISRTYEYVITRVKDPFSDEFAWYYAVDLDIQKMNDLCGIITAMVDFKSFSKSRSANKTFVCKVFHAAWEDQNVKLIFTIRADRFLRNMVRALVGTLIDAGRGKLDKNDFLNIFNAGDRTRAGVSVPACGLALTSIEYPDEIFDEC